MARLFALVTASLFTAACSSQPSQGTGSGSGSAGSAAARPADGGAPGSAGSAQAAAGGSAAAAKPVSARAQVEAASPAGAKVAPAEITVPGIELFLVSESRPSPEDEGMLPKLVGVSGGAGGTLLDGRDLVRAVMETKPAPKALAQIALWVAQDDGQLIEAAKTREQRKAKVGPPKVTANRLNFFVLTTDVPPMLEHGSLDMGNGLLDLALLPLPLKQAVSNAMTTLGTSHAVSRHVTAIRTLAAACSDARARQALLAALANHPRLRTRAAVADEAHRCGAPAVAALVTSMEQDNARQVRAQAAAALGRIGDPRARPALAKAARGDDANLAYAAGNALKKLK